MKIANKREKHMDTFSWSGKATKATAEKQLINFSEIPNKPAIEITTD